MTIVLVALILSQAAPEAAFVAADGKTLKLSDFRGKQVVVLLFMRGFTGEFACVHCGNQTRDYKKSYEALTAAGVEVLMVLPGAKDAKGFLKKVGEADDPKPNSDFSAPFRVVLDADFSATKAFGVAFDNSDPDSFPVDKPATFVIGKDGSILYSYHGKDPSDRPPADAILKMLRGEKLAESKPKPAVRSALGWVSYDEGINSAKAQKKPVLLDFYAEW